MYSCYSTSKKLGRKRKADSNNSELAYLVASQKLGRETKAKSNAHFVVSGGSEKGFPKGRGSPDYALSQIHAHGEVSVSCEVVAGLRGPPSYLALQITWTCDICIYIYIYICTCYTYVCMYMYVCVCIYIYTQVLIFVLVLVLP